LLPRYGMLGAAIAWAGRAIVDTLLLLLTCPVLLKETRAAVDRTLLWIGSAIVALGGCIVLSTTTARLVVAAFAIPLWSLIVWRWLLTREERNAPARMISAAWRPERA